MQGVCIMILINCIGGCITSFIIGIDVAISTKIISVSINLIPQRIGQFNWPVTSPVEAHVGDGVGMDPKLINGLLKGLAQDNRAAIG